MDSEVVDSMLNLMNKAEISFLKGQSRKTYVLNRVKKEYPDLDEDIVEDTLELLISVSKATLPLLFNTDQQKCSSCNIS